MGGSSRSLKLVPRGGLCSFRRASGRFDKGPCRDLKGAGDLEDVRQRNISFSALDPPDVGGVKADPVGKFLLRPRVKAPVSPDLRAERFVGRANRLHLPEDGYPQTMSPQTMSMNSPAYRMCIAGIPGIGARDRESNRRSHDRATRALRPVSVQHLFRSEWPACALL